ncbi:DNA polymerase III subunit theta [Klebsiella pneumoniae]|nr:DNA polymerase III subunit theta [Klebsiella pneumoniae]
MTHNLAALIPEERAKVNVDLVASGVAYTVKECASRPGQQTCTYIL